jgi:hypothetical protein
MAIIRNKNRVINNYGSLDRILSLPSTNKGKILYFNFETLSDIGTLSTQNIFSITVSGNSGNTFITASLPNQYVTRFHLEDSYIELNSQRVVVKSVDETTGVIELYDTLTSTFSNITLLNVRVLGSSIVNRFGTNSSTSGSAFAYLYRTNNSSWRLRSYATGALFTMGWGAGNSVFSGEIRLNSLLHYGNGIMRKRVTSDNQFVYGTPTLAIGGGTGGQLIGHLYRHGIAAGGSDVGFYDNVGGLGSANAGENIGFNLTKGSMLFGTHAKYISDPADSIAPNGFTFINNRGGTIIGTRNLLNEANTPSITSGLSAAYQPLISRGTMGSFDLYFEFSLILVIGYKNYTTNTISRLNSFFRLKQNLI